MWPVASSESPEQSGGDGSSSLVFPLRVFWRGFLLFCFLFLAEDSGFLSDVVSSVCADLASGFLPRPLGFLSASFEVDALASALVSFWAFVLLSPWASPASLISGMVLPIRVSIALT